MHGRAIVAGMPQGIGRWELFEGYAVEPVAGSVL